MRTISIRSPDAVVAPDMIVERTFETRLVLLFQPSVASAGVRGARLALHLGKHHLGGDEAEELVGVSVRRHKVKTPACGMVNAVEFGNADVGSNAPRNVPVSDDAGRNPDDFLRAEHPSVSRSTSTRHAGQSRLGA